MRPVYSRSSSLRSVCTRFSTSRKQPSSISASSSAVRSTTTPTLPAAAAKPARASSETAISSAASASVSPSTASAHAPVGLELAQQRGAVGLRERRLERRHALADARAERAEVRLHHVAHVVVRARREVHLVHVELVARSAPACSRSAASSAGSESTISAAASGWRTRSFSAVRTWRPSETISRTARITRESSAIDGRRVRRRVVAQVHALLAPAASGRAHQVLPDLLGRVGQEGREQLRERDQRLVERPVRVELVRRRGPAPRSGSRLRRTYQFESASTKSVSTPVGSRRGGRRPCRSITRVRRQRELGEDPAVEQRALARPGGGRRGSAASDGSKPSMFA